MITHNPMSEMLKKAIDTESTSRSFTATETRWLTLLLQKDPTLPVPTAGAMIQHVREIPIGAQLAALDDALQELEPFTNPEMTTSERRVTQVLLESVVSRASSLLGPTLS